MLPNKKYIHPIIVLYKNLSIFFYFIIDKFEVTCIIYLLPLEGGFIFTIKGAAILVYTLFFTFCGNGVFTIGGRVGWHWHTPKPKKVY